MLRARPGGGKGGARTAYRGADLHDGQAWRPAATATLPRRPLPERRSGGAYAAVGEAGRLFARIALRPTSADLRNAYPRFEPAMLCQGRRERSVAANGTVCRLLQRLSVARRAYILKFAGTPLILR